MAAGDSDWGRTTNVPSQAVVEALADAEGVSPAELSPPEYEPLHTVIDVEALDSLFESRVDGRPRSDGSVSFQYCGYTVRVDAEGEVTLEEVATDPEATESQ